eukprot:9311814-Alexandrium_andersonii.AAC.1
MSASLVGSEMCIRDRFGDPPTHLHCPALGAMRGAPRPQGSGRQFAVLGGCLLYTSDAADDM